MIAMVKKKIAVEDMIDSLVEDMKREYSHWLHIRENGCRDPYWTDGVNMNLTRNHIRYYKANIARLCEEKGLLLPDEYFATPTPPEVENTYMAKGGEYRERRMRTIGTSANNFTFRPPPIPADELALF